ncbi:putative serine/threonine-protein kinase dyrk2 isoform F [Glycine soja]|nr:putative serine/threonine-protein kinase dyrk2 isoform B [Glycine soja]RZB95456.1 putative serine/threonine-protein kinase dyrk2 isoform C [Glycine soja]RZB95459.1 putative serine/threonine-protein kinase dyrk2 isoform F [Glycine soja]
MSMADTNTNSVDVILDFLRRNRFTRAEAALLSEISNRPDLNAFLQKPQGQGQELIVKEIECGTKWKTTSEDLYSWKFNPTNGPVKATVSKCQTVDVIAANTNSKSGSGEENADKKSMWPASSSKASVVQSKEPRELDRQLKFNSSSLEVNFTDNPCPRKDENVNSSSDSGKDCSVKTVFPFSKGDVSTSFDGASYSYKIEEKKKVEISDTRTSIEEQVGELGRPIFLVKTPGSSEQKMIGSLSFPLPPENLKEDIPRLPPVKLKSDDKPLVVNWEEKFERDGPTSKLPGADSTLLVGSYLDVPIGQEINPSGMRKAAGGCWLSVSQGIAEDTSDLVSGFATVGDELSESIDYPNEYWDSDEYDDDEDVGYMRQPIEDEAWFLAHEIDYPSDNEKGTGHGSVPDPQERGPAKDEDDDQSFAEEDSYFSGERYLQENNVEPVTATDDPIGLTHTEYGRTNDNDLMAQYDGQLMDEEELNLMCAEPVWRGFVPQTNELIMLGDGRVLNDNVRSRLEDISMDDDQHGSVRSIGVGINSDAADIGSEVRESLVGGSSEGDLEYFRDRDAGLGGSRHSHHDFDKKSTNKSNKNKNYEKSESNKYVIGCDKDAPLQMKTHGDGNFSFPLSLKDGQMIQASTNKSLWSNNGNTDEADDCLHAFVGTDDMLALWRRKSSDSSPVKSSRDENNADIVRSTNSSPTTVSNYGYSEREHVKVEDEKTGIAREDDLGASLEDEEVAAVQEQVRQIKAQEEEFETFNLKIVHRKNRTGFEEDKNFHVVLNSVIAGRYHVTEYLGSAAFSKAIQAHDLHTGMDVCVKIIKNNKDFFDQSLDEIKLLKYVNKHDPADKYHILRLYDYFYYREHLLIVCELLKANLYEFHKFNRESGGEVYFTMPRLQSITIQCLEALQFLHSLGLIHCDLKPENILVKSYSRCEVKVIDLGSSCFETDHLCSYVQSRSYRAPEVILGLPYDKKIDIWSLGCILAELCTGNVLFQNDSPATLLARVIGIIGPIDQNMLAKGRDTYKYFTKNHMLYERNQETNRLEYLIPKKTSLRHRLPMGDQGFIDFVAHLLEVNPKKRPSASEALKHPWLSYPYEPISS